MMGLLLTAIGLAAGICGFVILVARGLRHVPWLSSGTAGDKPIAVVSRVVLKGNQGLAVVLVDGRRMLVSTGDGGVRLVAELAEQPPSEESPVSSLTPGADMSGRGGCRLVGAPFGLLRRVGVLLLVGFALVSSGPQAASAQAEPSLAEAEALLFDPGTERLFVEPKFRPPPRVQSAAERLAEFA